MSKLVGYTIAGRYRVDEFLGRGGMADVYKVWDQQRATWLAMKVLHESLAEDKVFLRRFRREATNLAKLRHPNIVRFYEWGEAGELVFILMEYVSGITLSKAIKRNNQPFSPRQALGIIQPVCSALYYAHEQGLAHCDIKPSNIMLDENGRVFLTDFGIARVTEGAATATMVGAGTPAYMSPEQVDGADPTSQTDIYAIGIVLFEMLTGGERPFTGERATITGTIGEKIRWEKRKLSPHSPRQYNKEITTAVESVVMRCLSKDRRNRYGSTTTLLDELLRAAGESTEALPASVFVENDIQIEKPAPSRKIFLVSGLVGLTCLFLLILGGVGALILDLPLTVVKRPTLPPPSPHIVTKVVELIVSVEVTPAQPKEKTADPPSPTKRPPTSTQRPPSSTPPPTSIPEKNLSVDIIIDNGARFLQYTGGPNNYNVKLGPVSAGELIMGSNEVFCIYVDIQGNVYIVRYESKSLRHLENIKKNLSALRNGAEPKYDLRLSTDDNGTYSLFIHEKDFGDSYMIKLPRNFTH